MQAKFNILKPTSFEKRKGKVPLRVAEFCEQEELNIKINFRYYNDKECEIQHLGANAKEVLKKFKIIGQSTRNELRSNGILWSSVLRVGDYSKIFRRLPLDFDDSVVELKLGRKSRVFCSFEKDNCYVIAIKKNHLETKKNRR